MSDKSTKHLFIVPITWAVLLSVLDWFFASLVILASLVFIYHRKIWVTIKTFPRDIR
jgi:hypothetical protein